ncbi:MAG: hypothetical protein IJ144_05590 [Prevotella sp.]|nr:hypothetical protein [Prevotella sp.]
MQDKETLFRQKADGYLCCFRADCPRREHCLRWEVGQYIAPDRHLATCVSPHYQKAADGACDLFRDNQPVAMPVGMKTRFYRDMPYSVQRFIKDSLIAHNCRSTYYQYHNGQRPITPDYLAVIRSVCRQAGWQGPLEFDGETTDYAW